MEDIRGLRVPYLKPGWNRQFLMMKEFGFVYDSSIPAPLSDPPLWPYTLDFKIPHKCIGRRKCPSRSFPGIWVRLKNLQFYELRYGAQSCRAITGTSLTWIFLIGSASQSTGLWGIQLRLHRQLSTLLFTRRAGRNLYDQLQSALQFQPSPLRSLLPCHLVQKQEKSPSIP